jgi:hypothetical protein
VEFGDGLPDDERSDRHDEERFECCAHVLVFAVTVGVIVVGRAGGEPNGDQLDGRDEEVGRGMNRFGKHADRSRDEPDG